ncbi:MAG: PEGA domain-containing protein [Cyclobacteriaceae bacterium]
MKKRFTHSLIILTVVGLVTGCASIIHGPTQSVDFSSQPSGAKITIDGQDYGVTPKSVDLRRKGRLKGENKDKKEYAVKIELEGFYPYEIKIKREMDGWFLGNIIFGGLIGIIIDAANGSMYKLTPDQIIAQMGNATAMNSNIADDKIYIAVTYNVDQNWQKIGTLKKSK